MGIKRTLTTCQITQFLVGASYAMLHSFISYVAPIKVLGETAVPVQSATAPVDSALPSVAGTIDSLKNLVFGAADTIMHAGDASTLASETVFITQPCVATSGETFAIWLNVLYLAPLTYLFVSFFIASYVKRSNAASKANGKARRLSNNVTLAEKAGWDAAKSIEKEVYGGEKMVDGSAVVDDDSPKKAIGSKRRRG